MDPPPSGEVLGLTQPSIKSWVGPGKNLGLETLGQYNQHQAGDGGGAGWPTGQLCPPTCAQRTTRRRATRQDGHPGRMISSQEICPDTACRQDGDVGLSQDLDGLAWPPAPGTEQQACSRGVLALPADHQHQAAQARGCSRGSSCLGGAAVVLRSAPGHSSSQPVQQLPTQAVARAQRTCPS